MIKMKNKNKSHIKHYNIYNWIIIIIIICLNNSFYDLHENRLELNIIRNDGYKLYYIFIL